MSRRRHRWSGSLLLVLGLVASACTDSPAPSIPQENRAEEPDEGPRPALSADPPIPLGAPIRPPTEAKELPSGPVAVLLDRGSQSVYEYDLARGRFLGPAPRLAAPTEKSHLPGYPTVFASGLTGRWGAWSGQRVLVPGGHDGTVAVIPFDPDTGLGTPHLIELPVIAITRPAAQGRGTATNAGLEGNPTITTVVPLGDEHAIATAPGPTTAYVIDLRTNQVVTSGQLEDEIVVLREPYRDGVLGWASRAGDIVHIGPDLSVVRRYPGVGRDLAGDLTVVGDLAVVASPTKLVVLDLRNGSTRVLSEAPGSGLISARRVVATKTEVWWLLGGTGEPAGFFGARAGPKRVRHISLSDLADPHAEVRTKDFEVSPCEAPSSMARYQDILLITCRSGGRLAVVPVDGGPVIMQDAGGIPRHILVPPGAGD